MKLRNRVAIVGVGLIGGSIGLGLLRRKLAREVIGVGRRQASLDEAQRLGVVSTTTLSLEEAVAGSDLVVVCTPVDDIVGLVRQAAIACTSQALITDAGSSKAEIVAQLEQAARKDPGWRAGVQFVGSHPLAGNDKRGSQHADAELLVGRVVVVTPTKATRPEAVEELSDFWSSLGARVITMSADEHDRAVAATSHLTHLVAAALAGATPEQYAALIATGWLDTTRVAGGDPQLWLQIMLSNRDHLLAAQDRFEAILASYRAALERRDVAELENLLTIAKQIRDALGN